MRDDRQPLFLARESRATASLMVAVGAGAGVLALAMASERAHPLLIGIVVAFAVLVATGALRMLVRPHEELRIDEAGVHPKGRPPVPWAQIAGVEVVPDSDGDDQLVLYCDDAWWAGVSAAWARWGLDLRDEDGNRGFVLASTSLRSRVDEWAGAIAAGLADRTSPRWPDQL